MNVPFWWVFCITSAFLYTPARRSAQDRCVSPPYNFPVVHKARLMYYYRMKTLNLNEWLLLVLCVPASKVPSSSCFTRSSGFLRLLVQCAYYGLWRVYRLIEKTVIDRLKNDWITLTTWWNKYFSQVDTNTLRKTGSISAKIPLLRSRWGGPENRVEGIRTIYTVVLPLEKTSNRVSTPPALRWWQ